MCRFFFFSSRRRHTRCSRDWSSDVCSSDLLGREGGGRVVLHDLLVVRQRALRSVQQFVDLAELVERVIRSEEHTSELQSRLHLVCRLLLEKKKKKERSPSSSEAVTASTAI